MAIIRCKMCGGELALIENQTVAECEYCGSRQTVPTMDNEKKLTLFARASRLRAACEFDKAAGIYETIVADFPEEAESYWGLVLCKYGIEYVDDPATGKKIPTCHRSSFESLMEDSDFEQTLENADALARRVYREEAKQIEELRKGIIAVSANEEPYDIFICYKETDENGQRTLDSVLAQDIYDALTEKGYRTFFARITLEDKLGREYEPYIFAALNSAKIMLAVGTDYEFYNAVWVKNEWSRFLKLMAKDKSKYLIPCYKGIDAYDMPKAFSYLQGQDMGKLGAMQDLLRGIGKLMPDRTHQPVRESQKVIFGGNNRIASLLDRGNMALEDEDWERADSFFEEVLNNDSQNALAYIGKTLVQEQCFTLEAALNRRMKARSSLCSETLHLRGDDDYIAEQVSRYTIPGYVTAEELNALYQFDLSYPSQLQDAKRQYQQEKQWWDTHKWLSRAERFAEGETAVFLSQQKKRLFAPLEKQMNMAREADEQEAARLRSSYEAHMEKADRQAEARYQKGNALRDQQARKMKRRKRRIKILASVAVVSLVVCAGLFALATDLDVQHSVSSFLVKNGYYQEACAILNRNPDYKDNRELLKECTYQAALKLEHEGDYQQAIELYESISDYKDSSHMRIRSCHYQYGCLLQDSGNYESAIAAFETAGKFADAMIRNGECYTQLAVKQEEEGNFRQAAIFYYKAGDKEKSMTLWRNTVSYQTIAAGIYHTVGLKNDGTVVAIGQDLNSEKGVVQPNGQTKVQSWNNIMAIAAGAYHTVGLKDDGTVVATGSNNCGQCDVSQWEDIVAIAAGRHYTAGLKADGTVVCVGEWVESAKKWTNVIEIAGGQAFLLGLRSDQTMVSAGLGTNLAEAKNVKSIAADGNYICLTEDGSVIGTQVQTSKKIKSVWAGGYVVLCILEDDSVAYNGTILSERGKYQLTKWETLQDQDIAAFAASFRHAVVLKKDGTVSAYGDNFFGACEVQNWKDIKLPR